MPVPLKISSTFKRNGTECFPRGHHAVPGVTVSSLAVLCYENHDVHTSVNDGIWDALLHGG